MTLLTDRSLVPIYRFALRLTRDAMEAEDLAQEAYLRAWRACERGPRGQEDSDAMRAWLFRITMNAWRDRQRRATVRRAAMPRIPHGTAAPDPSEALAGREQAASALAALDRLPDRQREVLYLSACEGLSNAAIAEVLAVSTDAVKASLSLARKRLRELLDPRPAEELR